ncbi:hypothetical protein F2P81_016510 [Scophthalmus maximus]|uniref:Uncharacterized protein n=1 Tax=Scophthalmus maximus TaxID=52904 RepID=A0A6A4SH69_SCOMX|nr:hypothetical protein F2P81_016510 [Scophthalmus maximus]
MTLPIATADTDSVYRHRFPNIVSVYVDPVSEYSQSTSLGRFDVVHTLLHLMFCSKASSERWQHKRKRTLKKGFDHMSRQRDCCSLSMTPFHSLLLTQQSSLHGDTPLSLVSPRLDVTLNNVKPESDLV